MYIIFKEDSTDKKQFKDVIISKKLSKDDKKWINLSIHKRKSVEKQSSYHIIGFLRKKSKNKSDEMVQIQEEPFPVVSRKPMNNKIIGYIKIGEKDYIAVVKKKLLPFILTGTIVLGAAMGYLYHHNKVDIPIIANTVSSVTDNSSISEDDTITFAGFSSSYNFTNGQYFYMSNPEGNSVYCKFEIVDSSNNKTIYESDMVPEGKSLQLDPYEIFAIGTTTVDINVSTYDVSTMEECTPFSYSSIQITLQ